MKKTKGGSFRLKEGGTFYDAKLRKNFGLK